MRDLAMFGAMLLMVPMSLMNAFVAFLLWGYTTVLSPVQYLYGFMQGVRYNFIFALIALVLVLFGRLPEKGRLRADHATILIGLFLVQALTSAALAPDYNLLVEGRVDMLLKGFAFVLLMPLFITSRLRLHATVLVIAFGLGLHGVVEGLKFIASGGSHRVVGLPGSSLSDNNLMAVGLVMVMPLLIYFFLHLQHRLARWAALAGLGLTVLAVIGTNSRGGLVALAIVGVWYVVTSRRKILALALVLVVAGFIMKVAPDEWFSRISTIHTAQDDGSFMNRVVAWKISSAIALAHPVFGLGFSAVNLSVVWYKYKDEPNLLPFIDPEGYTPKAAHSIYFQVMGDLGFVGLLLFLAVLASAFVSRMQIKREVSKRPRELQWARDLADALILSLVAFMAGGAAVSLAYYEVVYMLVAMLAILKTIVVQTRPVAAGAAPG